MQPFNSVGAQRYAIHSNKYGLLNYTLNFFKNQRILLLMSFYGDVQVDSKCISPLHPIGLLHS